VSETENNPQGEQTPAGEGASQNSAIESSGLSQEQVNVLVGNARKKERARAAEAIEEINSELEQTKAQMAEMQKAIDEANHARELEEWKAQAATEAGIPASILKGDTLEELQAHAAQIKAEMPAYPSIPGDTGETDPPAMTREEIYKIKNREQRIIAMGQHPELFS